MHLVDWTSLLTPMYFTCSCEAKLLQRSKSFSFPAQINAPFRSARCQRSLSSVSLFRAENEMQTGTAGACTKALVNNCKLSCTYTCNMSVWSVSKPVCFSLQERYSIGRYNGLRIDVQEKGRWGGSLWTQRRLLEISIARTGLDICSPVPHPPFP